MNRHFLIGIILSLILTLSGCASQKVGRSSDLSNETWMSQVTTSSAEWTRGADRWFIVGKANSTEIANRYAPYSFAMSDMNVRVPNFTKLKLIGNFEVQLFGTYSSPNSVRVVGPNDAVRQLRIQVDGDTLCVTQLQPVPSMGRVIVRIGMNTLTYLMHSGCASVEGIQMKAQDLCIDSYGTGRIYLAGNINVRRINQMSSGPISIFGATSSCLIIDAIGPGATNLIGYNIWLKSILHRGYSNINVIGATSTGLKIDASGSGKISLNGNHININQIAATDQVCIFAYNVDSTALYINLFKNAKVGLMGYANQLTANATDNAIFYGQHLCACNAFVRASVCGHLNISAGGKMFASAVGASSVYFYGSPELMTPMAKGSALILPMVPAGARNCLAGRQFVK